MSEAETLEKNETEAKAPKVTAFGAQVLAAAAELAANGDVVTVTDVAQRLGKAHTIVFKSSEKLAKDGYLELDANEEAKENSVIRVTAMGTASAAEELPEPKKPESAKRYRFLKDAEKGPPQMIGIIEALKGFENGEASHNDLMLKIGDIIVSRQSPNRVFQFYRGRMIESGYIEEA